MSRITPATPLLVCRRTVGQDDGRARRLKGGKNIRRQDFSDSPKPDATSRERASVWPRTRRASPPRRQRFTALAIGKPGVHRLLASEIHDRGRCWPLRCFPRVGLIEGCEELFQSTNGFAPPTFSMEPSPSSPAFAFTVDFGALKLSGTDGSTRLTKMRRNTFSVCGSRPPAKKERSTLFEVRRRLSSKSLTLCLFPSPEPKDSHVGFSWRTAHALSATATEHHAPVCHFSCSLRALVIFVCPSTKTDPQIHRYLTIAMQHRPTRSLRWCKTER